MGSGQIASDHIAYISTFGAEANTADTAACTTASPCMLVATPINDKGAGRRLLFLVLAPSTGQQRDQVPALVHPPALCAMLA